MKWSIKPELTPREKAEVERGKQARQVPKILAPPPAIFAVAIIGGALVNRSYGWAFGGGGPRQVAGLAVIAIGLSASFWAMQQYRLAKTSPDPKHRADALVTTGPYRHSRNPLYLAAAIMGAGLGVAMNMPGIVLALGLALLVLRNGVILREETYLEDLFGEAYLSYKARVRRWI